MLAHVHCLAAASPQPGFLGELKPGCGWKGMYVCSKTSVSQGCHMALLAGVHLNLGHAARYPFVSRAGPGSQCHFE